MDKEENETLISHKFVDERNFTESSDEDVFQGLNENDPKIQKLLKHGTKKNQKQWLERLKEVEEFIKDDELICT